MLVWFNKSAILQAQSKCTARERVNAINDIIDSLIAAQVAATIEPSKQKYSYEDGQTKVSVEYKDLAAVAAAIIVWERTKQIYLNQYNGRMARLVPGVNMPNFNLNVI